MSAPAPDLLTTLLRDVSRSFYLTLRLLPAAVRTPIGLAYLLARATDTVADTEALPLADRLVALQALRDRILGARTTPLDLSDAARGQASASERTLLLRIEEAIQVLAAFTEADRQRVREVLTTITSGQELDLQRFARAGAHQLVALRTLAELDDYTYRVAGCVGDFWTRICHAHLFPDAPLDFARYLEDGLRFGKGLQLVNILRDLPTDLRQGRCYVPEEVLGPAGLTPTDLLDAGTMSRFAPVYRRLLGTAADHLRAGWRYTCQTPRDQFRLRLGCALPLLIGAETLQALARGNVLDATHRIKVPRSRVRALLVRTVLLHPFRSRWERLFNADLPTTPARSPDDRA